VEDLSSAREYCEVRGPRSSLINNLVYPLPHSDGLSLGVHFTKTLWGTFLLGPTATYVDGKDNYEKDRLPIADFAHSAKTLLPEIEESDLQLGYSGLRPKLVPPAQSIADFVITRDPTVPQAIHLVGWSRRAYGGAGDRGARITNGCGIDGMTKMDCFVVVVAHMLRHYKGNRRTWELSTTIRRNFFSPVAIHMMLRCCRRILLLGHLRPLRWLQDRLVLLGVRPRQPIRFGPHISTTGTT